MLVAPYIANRFESTVSYYLRHRARYPATLVPDLCSEIGLTRQDKVLDLGCGPGSLAIDVARYGAGDIVGFDPDPAMLAAAREEASKAKVEVTFVQASSYELTPTLGPLKLVIMGRSFHWMDRVATLEALEAIVATDGAVVVVSELHEPARENRWKQVVRNVQNRFAGDTQGGPKNHAAVLLDSAFSRLDVRGCIERRVLSIDDIVGRAFSELRSSPEVLGSAAADFEADLRASLRGLSPSGAFSEIVHFSALIARRPTT